MQFPSPKYTNDKDFLHFTSILHMSRTSSVSKVDDSESGGPGSNPVTNHLKLQLFSFIYSYILLIMYPCNIYMNFRNAVLKLWHHFSVQKITI